MEYKFFDAYKMFFGIKNWGLKLLKLLLLPCIVYIALLAIQQNNPNITWDHLSYSMLNGLNMLLIFPLTGFIIYLMHRVINKTTQIESIEINPKFNSAELWRNGSKLFLLNFIYTAMFLGFIGLIIGWFIFDLWIEPADFMNQNTYVQMEVVKTIFLCFLVLCFWAFITTGATVLFAKNLKFSEAFNFKEILLFVFKNFGRIILLCSFYLGASFVLGLMLFIPVGVLGYFSPNIIPILEPVLSLLFFIILMFSNVLCSMQLADIYGNFIQKQNKELTE